MAQPQDLSSYRKEKAMADFNSRKLQVFVSSTFNDLVKERQAAVEAILTAGHIPAGMELFTAGDESQMDVIKQWIDESDVYLLILGGRYGSIEATSGKSYTHLEYDYAISKNKPFFACVIKDDAIEVRVKMEGRSVLETENPSRLKEFRATVLTKVSKFWDDTKDIKIAVAETLSGLARRDDLVGWVRARAQSDLPALADEIARLSKENALLRSQMSLLASAEDRINGLTFVELKAILDKVGASDFLMLNSHLLLKNRLGISVKRNDAKSSEAAEELSRRGLFDRVDSVSNASTAQFSLTESGRTYINKFDARKLAIDGTT